MGQARRAGSNWPDILEGRVVKLAFRIKFEPIGPARIGPQPIRVRARQPDWPEFILKFFIINFKKMSYIYIYEGFFF